VTGLTPNNEATALRDMTRDCSMVIPFAPVV